MDVVILVKYQALLSCKITFFHFFIQDNYVLINSLSKVDFLNKNGGEIIRSLYGQSLNPTILKN